MTVGLLELKIFRIYTYHNIYKLDMIGPKIENRKSLEMNFHQDKMDSFLSRMIIHFERINKYIL